MNVFRTKGHGLSPSGWVVRMPKRLLARGRRHSRQEQKQPEGDEYSFWEPDSSISERPGQEEEEITGRLAEDGSR